MNRRDFLARVAAVAAAPSVLPAAQAAPAPKPASHMVPKDALLFEAASDLQQMAEHLRGDHPLRLRGFSFDRGTVCFEFDVLASCTYTPPAGVDLNMPARACCLGDVVAIHIHLSSPTIQITPLNLP